MNGKWQYEGENISSGPFMYFVGLRGKNFQGLTIKREQVLNLI